MKKININEYLDKSGMYKPLSDENAYGMTKNCFQYIDFEIYKILDKRGMLGKLWRGYRIELPNDNVIVEECWWRQMYHNLNKVPAPMFGCKPKL